MKVCVLYSVASLDTPHAQYVIFVVLAKVVPFGGNKDEIWNLTPLPQKY